MASYNWHAQLRADGSAYGSGKPVELRNHQCRAVDFAGRERLVERRPIMIVLAALDLDVLCDQLPAPAVEEALDRRALRFEAKARFALPLSADAKVRNKFTVVLDENAGLPTSAGQPPPPDTGRRRVPERASQGEGHGG